MFNLESLQDYIQGLNYKAFVRMIFIYIISFIGVVFLLLYRHHYAVVHAEQKIKSLNKSRQKIQEILTEYDHIKNKKNEVDILLAKDKNFYLQKYYQDAIKDLKIISQNAPQLVSAQGPSGYVEESLQINFAQISMKQLCEFLQALQLTPRVFVKNLDIMKANIDQKINVSLSLATLKPILETAPSLR